MFSSKSLLKKLIAWVAMVALCAPLVPANVCGCDTMGGCCRVDQSSDESTSEDSDDNQELHGCCATQESRTQSILNQSPRSSCCQESAVETSCCVEIEGGEEILESQCCGSEDSCCTTCKCSVDSSEPSDAYPIGPAVRLLDSLQALHDEIESVELANFDQQQRPQVSHQNSHAHSSTQTCVILCRFAL